MNTRMLLWRLALLACSASSAAATVGSFLVTNNDVPPTYPPPPAASTNSSTLTFYAIEANGAVRNKTVVATGGMAVNGSMMIVTYGAGSIASFDISGGMPVSNGDAQNAAGYSAGHLPNGVVITADGHYAIFGDASTVTTLEVSAIASGKLAPTVAYDAGTAWNSGNVTLSPDERLIFATNNSGGGVTAAFFDNQTGRIFQGCSSGPLRDFYSTWSYAGAAALQRSTAAGGLLYVPEFGSNGVSFIGIVQVKATRTACTLCETANSPIAVTTTVGAPARCRIGRRSIPPGNRRARCET